MSGKVGEVDGLKLGLMGWKGLECWVGGVLTLNWVRVDGIR